MKKLDTAKTITTEVNNLRLITGKHFITYSTGKPQRFQVMASNGETIGHPMAPREFISHLVSMNQLIRTLKPFRLELDVPERLERAIEDCHHFADTITNGTEEERLAIVPEIGNTADDLEYIKFHVIDGGSYVQT